MTMTGRKERRLRLLKLLTAAVVAALFVTLSAFCAAADEYTVAAILSADGTRQDYAVMEAAVADAQPGDTLVILNDWVPSASITFPAGVTVLVPGGVTAGNSNDAVSITILGTLKSTGTLVGNWQLQGNVTISWDVDGDGVVDERQVVSYGETPTHADGVRAREGLYVYNFAGWDKTIGPATADVTYTARFTRVVSDFVIGWDIDGNGTVDESSSYAYGETPTPPCDGMRADDAAKTYKFIGWDSEIVPAAADVVYTAQFSASPRSYTISLDTDGDGAAETTVSKTYGSPLAPENGVKKSTDEYNFTFAGWLPALQDVTADATYYAQFVAVSKNDSTAADGVLTVSMLNMEEEALSLLVTLQSSGTYYAAKPVTIGAGLNGSVSLTELPDGTYSLVITDTATGGCLYVGIITVENGSGSCAVMLSGNAPVFTVSIDEDLTVVALDLPESLLNREASADYAGLTAKDLQTDPASALSMTVKVLGEDAPFYETLAVAAGNQKIGLCLQLTLAKTVSGNVTSLDRVSDLVTVLFSVGDTMREQLASADGSMTICRICGGVTDKLTETPNVYGEYYAWEDDDTLRLCLRSSGTYALACDVTQSGFPLWWILLLVDAAGAFILYLDRKMKNRTGKPIDYPIRLGVALILTGAVVGVLALRQSVTEIVFASIGWLILTLLICWSGTGNRQENGNKTVPLSPAQENGQAPEITEANPAENQDNRE